jgi:hypothetical protein
MKRLAAGLALFFSLLLVAVSAEPLTVRGQLLAYQDGYVFFTTGDGFHVAPNVAILDAQTHEPVARRPQSRDYAKAIFNARGQVVEIDLSKTPYPIEPLPDDVRGFVVAASTPYPNPDLAPPPSSHSGTAALEHASGRLVLVKFSVQVPPATPLDAEVYIATDQSDWNPMAIPMDRVDALHFQVVRRMASGTILHYLYTRGSLQTEEVGPSGLSMKPREIVIHDSDTNSTNGIVAQWADANQTNLLNQPSVFPTPYNPAPFPNLPNGTHTPHP